MASHESCMKEVHHHLRMKELIQPMVPDLSHDRRICLPLVDELNQMQMVHNHEQGCYLGSYIQ